MSYRMPDEASLLTKTQRKRIRNGFTDLSGSKKRRDKQRIRIRIAAGVEDFHLLVDYPDEQLQMAFEEYDDDQLADSLADCQLVIERVREVRGINSGTVRKRVRDRVSEANEGVSVEPSLRQLADSPLAVEDLAPDDRGGQSLWSQRANRLFKLAACLLFPVVPFWLADLTLDTTLLTDFAPWWVAFAAFAFTANGLGLAVKFTQFMKYDAVPALTLFLKSPRSAVLSFFNRGLTAIKRAVKRSWERL